MARGQRHARPRGSARAPRGVGAVMDGTASAGWVAPALGGLDDQVDEQRVVALAVKALLGHGAGLAAHRPEPVAQADSAFERGRERGFGWLDQPTGLAV